MWLAIDTETYEYYDGSQESENFIVSQMITKGDQKKFRKEKQKGYYYPLLKAQELAPNVRVIQISQT